MCVCAICHQRAAQEDDSLLSQVYMYQNYGNVYLCGFFNCRCGELEDFLEGVDDVPDRDVVDHTTNGYGQFLW